MASVKSLSGKNKINRIVKYVKNPSKTNDDLISGINCNVDTCIDEMSYTKSYFNKNKNIQYFHVIQSFKPGEVTPKKAHEVGKELTNNIAKNYECLVVTHIDKEHIHNHIVINSVSYKDGKKYQVENGAYRIKSESDKICAREKLSVIEKGKRNKEVKSMSSNEYRAAINSNVEWWKGQVIIDIKECQLRSNDKEAFIKNMEGKGYKVKWSDARKNITYTTPDGKKVRDSKLHDESLLKEAMENGFKRTSSKEYEGTAERNITGATSQGLINGTVRRAIERDKQESCRAENSISESTGADLYTKLTEQGDSKFSYSSDGITRESIGGAGAIKEGLYQYSGKGTKANGEISKHISERGSNGSLEEHSEKRIIETYIPGESKHSDARGISFSNNKLNNNNVTHHINQVSKNKSKERER